jgi:hypothetical protein
MTAAYKRKSSSLRAARCNLSPTYIYRYNNESLLDQVIFGIVYLKLCSPGIKDIAQDRELVALLLVRHFKNFDSLALPPLAAASDVKKAHDKVVKADIVAGHEMRPTCCTKWSARIYFEHSMDRYQRCCRCQAQDITTPPSFFPVAYSSTSRGLGGGFASLVYRVPREGYRENL